MRRVVGAVSTRALLVAASAVMTFGCGLVDDGDAARTRDELQLLTALRTTVESLRDEALAAGVTAADITGMVDLEISYEEAQVRTDSALGVLSGGLGRRGDRAPAIDVEQLLGPVRTQVDEMIGAPGVDGRELSGQWERVYVEAGRSLIDRVGDAIRDDDAGRSALPGLYLTGLRQRIVLWDMRSTAFGSVFSAGPVPFDVDPAAAPRMQELATELADGLESVATLAADSAYEPVVAELLQDVESRDLLSSVQQRLDELFADRSVEHLLPLTDGVSDVDIAWTSFLHDLERAAA